MTTGYRNAASAGADLQVVMGSASKGLTAILSVIQPSSKGATKLVTLVWTASYARWATFSDLIMDAVNSASKPMIIALTAARIPLATSSAIFAKKATE